MERAESWKPREVARLLALLHSDLRIYQDVLTALPVAVAVLSADRTIVSFNRAFCRILQLSSSDLFDKRIEHVLPSGALIEHIRSAHLHVETPPLIVTIGGRSVRAIAAALPSRGVENEPRTLLALEEIRAVSQPEEMPGAIPAILWQADGARLMFRRVTGAAREILGHPASHWLESPRFFAERIHPGDRSEVMSLYMRVLSSGGEASAEFRALHASGEPVWVRETISVPPPAGQRVIAGVLLRIGPGRELELLAQNAARFDALRELSGRLAHDINNPLMIVRGYADDALESLPADSPLRAGLGQIVTAAGRIAEVTARLAEIAHAEPGAPAEIALAPLLQSLGGSMPVDISPTTMTVLASAAPLEEAIRAIAGSTQIRISCEAVIINQRLPGATLSPGAYARLKISPASALPFSNPAFARAYANIRSWGGDILQTGAVTHLYLRAGGAAPAPAPPPAEPTGPVTILLAEDEAEIRRLLGEILRREGYRVLVAASAEEAESMAALQPGRIDLLLTDVMLGGSSGLDLAQELAHARPGLRAVYMSGFTGEPLPPGAHFLQKPFSKAALLAKIREALL